MSRHRLALLLPLLLVPATFLAGCTGSNNPSSGAPKPGVLRLAMHDDFRTLDPAIAADAANIALLRVIYLSLLDFDDDVNLVPRLAEALRTKRRSRQTHLDSAAQERCLLQQWP